MLPVTPKHDGTMLTMFNHHETTVMATRGSADPSNQPQRLAKEMLKDTLPALRNLLDHAASITLEMVHKDMYQVQPERDEGLFLIQVLTPDGCFLGADDLNTFCALHKTLLDACNIRFHPVVWKGVGDVTKDLAALDAVPSVKEIKEGFVAKLQRSVLHPGRALLLNECGGRHAALVEAMDEAVAGGAVRRSSWNGYNVYSYTDAYNETTARADWSPVVAACCRGCVTYDGEVVGWAMPKFWGVPSAVDAQADPETQHKLKSTLYLAYSRAEAKPTPEYLSKLVRRAGTRSKIDEALQHAGMLLDGLEVAHVILGEWTTRAEDLLRDARALAAHHGDKLKEIGLDASAPKAVKKLAFLVAKSKAAHELEAAALSSVVA